MQRYRLFPTYRYLFLIQGIPVLHSGNGQGIQEKDSNKLLPNLLPPQHFQEHEQGPPSSLCTAHKGDYATFMAITQESLQVEVLVV